ncbi:PQQ-dependent sugar dehydrogenase [Microbulbifer yueqingensis]|uniref:Glucose/arabinose dehydrogenase, beta-propeller fold n=1 Tax=Microbulbifer yueqingensis TaxID=658219 RepID=A0A1G8XXN7_9GAMM|nr:PQQ-dependent sugar dehydrogenase [Microbulbifer yueqingensis]SDJ95301.1 Glucose/arabinose dehydrogenase, beta-propeller fold [Microbulbifer yueqingensis]
MLKYALTFLAAVGLGLVALVILTPGVDIPWKQLTGGADTDPETVDRQLRAAEGYRVELFASDLPNARWLAVTRSGDLVVSQPKSGQVTLVRADRDGDGSSDDRRVLIDGLTRPHGLVLHEDWLYIAESDAIGRVAFDHSDGRLAGSYQRIVTGLADRGNHWTKTIGMGPDGWLYLSSGSSCNVCEEENQRRATIMRLRPDGSDLQVFATGLRNSVGFDWSPKDGGLYATDNGRDWLGDDFPPDELNLVEQGVFYGWPYANGDRVPDPDLGADAGPEIQARIASSRPPAHKFAAHNAPLGIRFLRSPGQLPAYRDAALVALHGSWNRSVKDGYKVVSLHWDDSGAISQRDFLWGFLGPEREEVYGRPVAIAEDAAGNIYVSDDYAGAVYRVSRGEQAQPAAVTGRSSPLKAPHKPVAIDSDAARRGEEIYQRHNCGECHAEQVVLEGLSEKYTLRSLADYFDAPTPPMPDYGFSRPQKRALAHYLLSREQELVSPLPGDAPEPDGD